MRRSRRLCLVKGQCASAPAGDGGNAHLTVGLGARHLCLPLYLLVREGRLACLDCVQLPLLQPFGPQRGIRRVVHRVSSDDGVRRRDAPRWAPFNLGLDARMAEACISVDRRRSTLMRSRERMCDLVHAPAGGERCRPTTASNGLKLRGSRFTRPSRKLVRRAAASGNHDLTTYLRIP